jgi:transposase-like protein
MMTDLTPTQKSLLDELFKDFRGNAKELLGEHGLLKRITQRALESALEGELTELYGAEISPTLISNVPPRVLEEVQAWQARPLDAVYPILYFDCLFVKSRQEGPIRNKAVYLALGINLHGEKELLDLWMAETEGAKFWLSVFNELKTRGVDDCFIACVDGLKGLPEAIETVYPRTQVQLCIVHQVRNSLKYVTWKDRKAVAASLRTIRVHRSGRQRGTGRLHGAMGRAVFRHRAGLAEKLGAPHAVL